jgi:hypothetical protein
MLYGCRCGVVDNPNCLMTSAEMRFFWLPLSTIKCRGVPFTHIFVGPWLWKQAKIKGEKEKCELHGRHSD